MADSLKQKLLEEYRDKQQLYAEFAFLVKNLLERFLVGEKFKFQIFHRAKDVEKLTEKIDRKLQEGRQCGTLDDIEDLAGVRVVFYLEDDKKNFLELFLREFKNCIVNQKEKYDPRGYRGRHIVFCLNKERAALVEYRKYAELKCEIQVSTILFHAWSEVEHDIIYKPWGDKQLLQTLGLDDLKQSFEKVMVEHLQAATFQLDYLNKKYKAITEAGKIFGSDLLADISLSKNNDEVYEILEVVGDFYHKKPEETLALVNVVISKEPLAPVLSHYFGGHEIYGKTHKDLIMKCLELLANVRYFKPDEVLQLLAVLSLSKDKDISSKALEVTEKFTKYDYNILTKSKIGYGAQRKALDFVLAWPREEQLRHFDFVKVILKELLGSSVEGSEMTKEDTLTMHFGVVSPTDFLKKMRRETVDLVYDLYKATEDPKLKLKLVNILEETTRTPSNVLYGEDVTQMIVDDLKYLAGIYHKIIFGEDGDKTMDNLSIVEAIEQRLYWFNKSEKFRCKESEVLSNKILQSEFYQLFRLLVGDPITYQEGEGWDVAEQKRAGQIDKLIDSIKESELEEWSGKLNKIAAQHMLIDDWQFGTFKIFIHKLTKSKPQFADRLLDKAFKNNLPLKHFTESILHGFRIGAHFDLWDKYVNEIINAKDIQLIGTFIYSLNLPETADLEKYIRDKDIDLLGAIVKGQNQFAFLKGQDDLRLHHALINTLGRNYKRAPTRVEPLIVEEFRSNPKHLKMFFMQLPFMLRRNWLDFQKLQKETVELLKDQMVELPDIDWRMQELLLAIGQREGLATLLDVFLKRIQKDAERKEKQGRHIDERYEAIPYHFNPELSKFIIEHPDYAKTASEWIAGMTTAWSIYNWHVSHFLQRIGQGFDYILMSLIKKGDDDSLMKAACAMHSIDGVNFDLCIEIVRRTDNKRILSQVRSNMYATGVVSGEYGGAEAYEKKAKELEKYQTDESERVKKFVERMIKSFQESATRERQRADEEIQLRKIEFEG